MVALAGSSKREIAAQRKQGSIILTSPVEFEASEVLRTTLDSSKK